MSTVNSISVTILSKIYCGSQMINTACVQIRYYKVRVFQVDNQMKQQIWYHVKNQLSLKMWYQMWYQVVWEACYKIRHKLFYD